MPTTFDVKTQGVDQLINRLKGFEPEVYKVLQQETKAAAMTIVTTARSFVPEQPAWNWGETGRLGWSQSKVQGGIRPAFRTRSISRTRYVMALVTNKTPAGSLWELAGSRTSTQFGDLMNRKWGSKYPRAFGPAWTMNVDQVRDAIQEAINRAAEKVTNG